MPKKITLKPTPIKKQVLNWTEILKALKTPHITEKASLLEETSKYIFKVPLSANKVMIRQAIENLYGKKVIKIGIINTKKKARRKGRKIGYRPGYKKAIVSLKKGEKLEIFSAK